MAKIFNPTKSPFGVRLPGNVKAFIRPGETVDLDLDSEQLTKLEKRGCVVQSEKVTQVSDIDLSEYADGVLTNGQSLDLASMTDDELRVMAKAKGLKLHHKTGRAKLIEALEL